MLSYNNNELYKHKAHKYLKKYLNLKKIKGGSINKSPWYDDYITEVEAVYDEDKYIITGSGAVAIYLHYFNSLANGNFNELISILRIPNDVDFLYYCKGVDYISSRKIGKYSRLQDTPQTSITYEFYDSDVFPKFIKSFDVTCLSKISYVQVHKFKLLSLEKLLEFYSQELEDYEMFSHHYRSKAEDIKKRLTESKKDIKISEYLNLEEEYEIIKGKLENNNNKVLSLELKINIIDTLIKHIKTDAKISSKYNIAIIPDMSSPTRDKLTFDTEVSTDNSDDKLSSPSFFRQLFGITDDIETKEETELTSPPNVTRKLDFGFETPKSKSHKITLPTPSSDVKVEYAPYEIKFDFEKEV